MDSHLTLQNLPSEVLLKIFDGKLLAVADLAAIKQVCKRFNELAPLCRNFTYTFAVDAPTHPTYKLVRAILRDPQIGLQFSSVAVKWHRRDPEDQATWTQVWEWTEEEHDKLRTLMSDPLPSDYSLHAVILGCNSEALLPILLFYTPNVTFLDLGEVELDFFHADVDSFVDVSLTGFRALYRILSRRTDPLLGDSSLGLGLKRMRDAQSDEAYMLSRARLLRVPSAFHDFDGRPYRYISMMRQIYTLDIEVYQKPAPGDCRLWAHANATPRIPGFANLRHIEHGLSPRIDIRRGTHPIMILPMLMLPNLETFRAAGISSYGLEDDLTLDEVMKHGSEWEGMKSNLKFLELRASRLTQAEWAVLADFTRCLEYLAISIDTRQTWVIMDRFEEQADEIAVPWIENNKDTLTEYEVQGWDSMECRPFLKAFSQLRATVYELHMSPRDILHHLRARPEPSHRNMKEEQYTPLSSSVFSIDEILEQIMLELPAVMVLTTCRGVCRDWRELVDSSWALRYYSRMGCKRLSSRERTVGESSSEKWYTIRPMVLEVLRAFWKKLAREVITTEARWSEEHMHRLDTAYARAPTPTRFFESSTHLFRPPSYTRGIRTTAFIASAPLRKTYNRVSGAKKTPEESIRKQQRATIRKLYEEFAPVAQLIQWTFRESEADYILPKFDHWWIYAYPNRTDRFQYAKECLYDIYPPRKIDKFWASAMYQMARVVYERRPAFVSSAASRPRVPACHLKFEHAWDSKGPGGGEAIDFQSYEPFEVTRGTRYPGFEFSPPYFPRSMYPYPVTFKPGPYFVAMDITLWILWHFAQNEDHDKETPARKLHAWLEAKLNRAE
ncbi:hypothetical protein Dda_1987 [Drechslerella dactyloides]|uniref:F-box domain-containing protein n=1 Tax=Drechslerella dactyloides TaxID=74499 RepID=A0AAD6NLY2_DREDA|nr:hypothetical protein Dda_1987 [Drechslerella dactyloides]